MTDFELVIGEWYHFFDDEEDAGDPSYGEVSQLLSIGEGKRGSMPYESHSDFWFHIEPLENVGLQVKK